MAWQKIEWSTYGRLRREPSFVRTILVILLLLWGLGGPTAVGAIGLAGNLVGLGLLSATLGVGWLGGLFLLGSLALLVPVHYRIEQASDDSGFYVEHQPLRFE